ncbi:hypothetical protein LY76DRAFT_596013 [Colletotrichum caudatum]|nr:hypothetical protein LY76DRAFT_596013 [Colletotrichum caudatum]
MVSLKSIITAACLVQFGAAALTCNAFATGGGSFCRVSKDGCDMAGATQCPGNVPPAPGK